ncbi:MAG: hypothetical protein AB8G22_26335 [Saprospiraceae bacterium]
MRYLIFLFIGLFHLNLSAQSESLFDLLQYQEVLEVRLETDVATLQENRRNEEYQPSTFSFTDKNGVERALKMKLKPRGKFRRMNCSVPPLKLKWKKDYLEEQGIRRDFNDLKMVTHCSDNKKSAIEWIQREYLAYQMYAELTDFAYRTQLIKVTYVNAETGAEEEQWGMLIEDTAELAQRTASTKSEDFMSATMDKFQADNAKEVSLFQYMIGNADVDYQVGKNLKFFQTDGKLMTVPYDFDHAYFVNADYAIPNPNYGLLSTRERVFIGFPEHYEAMDATQKKFRKMRKTWMHIINDFELLPKKKREEMKNYIHNFFVEHSELNWVEKEVRLIDSSVDR